MPLFSSLKWIAGKNADDSAAAASSAPTNGFPQLDTRSDSFLQCLDQLIEEAQSEPHRSSSVAPPSHGDLQVTPAGHVAAFTAATRGQNERHPEHYQVHAQLPASEREEGEVSGDEAHVDYRITQLEDQIARLTRQSGEDILSGRFQSAPPSRRGDIAVGQYSNSPWPTRTDVLMPRGKSAEAFTHYGRHDSFPRSHSASNSLPPTLLPPTSRAPMPPPQPPLSNKNSMWQLNPLMRPVPSNQQSPEAQYKGDPVGALRNLATKNKWPEPGSKVQQESCGGWTGKLIVNDQIFKTHRTCATIRELEDELALIAYPVVFGFEYPPSEFFIDRMIRGRNAVTELNNYIARYIRCDPPRYHICGPHRGPVQGEVHFRDFRFDTVIRRGTHADAKAELAAKAFRCFLGVEWNNRQPISRPAVAPMLMNLESHPDSSKTYSEVSFLNPVKFVSVIARQQHKEEPKYVSDLVVDSHCFTFALMAATLNGKSLVEDKAYQFFLDVTSPCEIKEIPGFDVLKNSLSQKAFGRPEVQVFFSLAMIQVDIHDAKGKFVETLRFNMAAPLQLTSKLERHDRQTPQWYERVGITKSGQVMYACLMTWTTTTEVFGDLSKGYPTAILARAAAATSALACLGKQNEQTQKRKWGFASSSSVVDEFECATEDCQESPSKRPRSEWQSDTPMAPKSTKILHTTPQKSYSEPLDVDRGIRWDRYRPEGSRVALYPEVDSFRPEGSRVPLYPEIDSFRPGMGSNKRSASPLLKENEPFKKIKKEPGHGLFGTTDDDNTYDRVDHVDGRFGF